MIIINIFWPAINSMLVFCSFLMEVNLRIFHLSINGSHPKRRWLKKSAEKERDDFILSHSFDRSTSQKEHSRKATYNKTVPPPIIAQINVTYCMQILWVEVDLIHSIRLAPIRVPPHTEDWFDQLLFLRGRRGDYGRLFIRSIPASGGFMKSDRCFVVMNEAKLVDISRRAPTSNGETLQIKPTNWAWEKGEGWGREERGIYSLLIRS